MEATTSRKCTRPGCGKTFTEAENTDGSCVYHAAMPVFHDGVKKWPCCDQESWDWTEFMEIRGCTSGKHSDDKPQKPPAAPSPPSSAPAVVKDIEEFNREQQEASRKEAASAAQGSEPQLFPLVTPEGKYKCCNKGCHKEYSPEENSSTACNFHPGEPIFRDCMKSWSCCKAKSYDWDEFMKIPPCQTGSHMPKMVAQS